MRNSDRGCSSLAWVLDGIVVGVGLFVATMLLAIVLEWVLVPAARGQITTTLAGGKPGGVVPSVCNGTADMSDGCAIAIFP